MGIHHYMPGFMDLSPDYMLDISYNKIENTNWYNGIRTDVGIMVECGMPYIFGSICTDNSISNNYVYNATTGIWARNFDVTGCPGWSGSISTNTVTLFQGPASVITGIKKTNTGKALQVSGNIVTGGNPTYYSDARLEGITMESNTYTGESNDVVSNTIKDCGKAVHLFGNNGGMQLKCNKFDNHQRGIELDNTTIVAQGSSGTPSNNQWLNSNNYQIYGVGSFSIVDWWDKSGTLSATKIFPSNAVNIRTTTGPACIIPPPAIAGGTPDRRTNANPPSTLSQSGLQSYLSATVDQKFKSGFAKEDAWYAANNAYSMLRKNPILMNLGSEHDAKLEKFYTSAEQKNFKRFADLTEALSHADVEKARSINSSIVPENTIESNLKDYNSIYLSTVAVKNNITVEHEDQLERLAKQCPITGGPAVYYSRSLLGYARKAIVDFPNDCPSTNEQTTPVLEEALAEINLTVFPNPNNGNMQIQYELGEDEKGIMIITDIAGRKVAEYALKEGKNLQAISETELENGIYHYSVIVNGKSIKTEKLIIIK